MFFYVLEIRSGGLLRLTCRTLLKRLAGRRCNAVVGTMVFSSSEGLPGPVDVAVCGVCSSILYYVEE